MPISENVILYMKKGQNSSSWTGGAWGGELLSDAPVGFDGSHTFYGAAGGIGGDHALNVCGRITDAGKVEIQTQNLYAGTVSATIYWWAYIIEILG